MSTKEIDIILNINASNKILYWYWDGLSQDTTIKKISDLRMLPEGWEYGENGPPNDETINKAINIYLKCNVSGFASDSRPGIERGIIVSFYKEDNFVDIYINPDLTIDFKYEKGIGVDYDVIKQRENVKINEIVGLLHAIKKEWPSSEHFISGDTASPKDDFQVTVFSQIETKKYLSSWKTVQEPKVQTPFVIIS